MGLLNYLLYRPQVKLPYIGMVNIVAQKLIIPEFIQFRARPKKIAQAALGLLRDADKLSAMREDLSRVKTNLGEKGASSRAASAILQYLTAVIASPAKRGEAIPRPS
jgi:lipid-A-disaccharide synthase